MPFLPPNQQRQGTESTIEIYHPVKYQGLSVCLCRWLVHVYVGVRSIAISVFVCVCVTVCLRRRLGHVPGCCAVRGPLHSSPLRRAAGQHLLWRQGRQSADVPVGSGVSGRRWTDLARTQPGLPPPDWYEYDLPASVTSAVSTRGPVYKISYDLSYDYLKIIVRSTYYSYLKRAKISLRNIVSYFTNTFADGLIILRVNDI